MRYVADAVQMEEIDRRTSEEIGIPPIVLMEKAAEQIARRALQMLGGQKSAAGKRVLAVYGAGGNGGDAVAAARLLHLKGVSAVLFSAGERAPRELTKMELSIAKKCGVTECKKTCNDMDFSAYDMILDGIFGIGLSRQVDGAYRTLIERINASNAKVLAIDIPSGIHAGTGECLGTAVRADCTVTFGEYKIGHFLYPGASHCGKLVLADAGFVPEICRRVLKTGLYRCTTYETSDVPGLLPPRVPRSHKGSYGKVLLYAGSEQVTGAAYLAAKAAYRCGVGLVKLVSTKGCLDIVRQMLPEALCEELPEAGQEEFWGRQVRWADAVLAGPGLGTGKAAVQGLLGLFIALKELEGLQKGSGGEKPLVLDADALNILAGFCGTCKESEADIPAGLYKACAKGWGSIPAGLCTSSREGGEKGWQERLTFLTGLLPKHTILTPHPKELSRLTGFTVKEITEHFIDTAKKCSYNNELIYVLKDAHTVVACGNEIYINRSGCDGMATGGSGDVLAGMIVGLCITKAPQDAAKAGVFLHGLAGERAQQSCGCRGMLAGDILDGMLLTENEERRGSAAETVQGYGRDGV